MAQRGSSMAYVSRGCVGQRAGRTEYRGRMHGSRIWRGVLLALLMVSFAGAPAQAADLDYDWEIADLLIVRPLGLGAVFMGSVFFIVAAPLTYFFSEDEVFEDSLDRCVRTPGAYVFTRPLGEF